MQCNATYRKLNEVGLDFKVIDVSEDVESYKYITGELGYLQAPVVLTADGEHWSGFRPDKIEEVANRLF